MDIIKCTLFLFSLSLAASTKGQDSTRKYFIGKWAMCYSLDSLDSACLKPFAYIEFNADGHYIAGYASCGEKKYPRSGTWRFEEGNLSLDPVNNECIRESAETYANIQFLNKKIFYFQFPDQYENPGHIVFMSYRRIE
jgi:hypothetical protein